MTVHVGLRGKSGRLIHSSEKENLLLTSLIATPKMAFRRPFFPPEEFAHVDPDLAAMLSMLPKAPEGHISPAQAEFLYHLIRLIRPQLVVETGFCVGHSACVILLAQRSVGLAARLLSVDICRFPETAVAAKYVSSKFPEFMLIRGDTKSVLSNAVSSYLREREGVTFDLGIIDGGHDAETASSDLEVLTSLLSLGGYLYLDDFETIIPYPGVNRAGRAFALRWGNCVRFRTADTRGFMLFQKGF
jgi:predicted O-methyltransferase YrrM